MMIFENLRAVNGKLGGMLFFSVCCRFCFLASSIIIINTNTLSSHTVSPFTQDRSISVVFTIKVCSMTEFRWMIWIERVMKIFHSALLGRLSMASCGRILFCIRFVMGGRSCGACVLRSSLVCVVCETMFSVHIALSFSNLIHNTSLCHQNSCVRCASYPFVRNELHVLDTLHFYYWYELDWAVSWRKETISWIIPSILKC